MEDRIGALSQRQRECLRLVAQGLEAKEIARVLGISDQTVKNHLGAARATLGTARSITAARLLVAAEAGTSGTGTPPGIADRSYLDVETPGQPDGQRTIGGLGDGSGFAPVPMPPAMPLPFRTRRGQRNDLGIGARLAIIVVLTVLLIAAVGFFVEASRGLRL
jgi:DNA-binding CsgD family transcriptional regulator